MVRNLILVLHQKAVYVLVVAENLLAARVAHERNVIALPLQLRKERSGLDHVADRAVADHASGLLLPLVEARVLVDELSVDLLLDRDLSAGRADVVAALFQLRDDDLAQTVRHGHVAPHEHEVEDVVADVLLDVGPLVDRQLGRVVRRNRLVGLQTHRNEVRERLRWPGAELEPGTARVMDDAISHLVRCAPSVGKHQEANCFAT